MSLTRRIWLTIRVHSDDIHNYISMALMFESAVILLQGTRFFTLLRVKGWENLNMGHLVAKLMCHNLHNIMTQATMNHKSQ